MTRKDSEKDSERPHYYSQFWLDVAAGRRIIGMPKPNDELEPAESELPEPISLRRPVREEEDFISPSAASDGQVETIAHPVVEPMATPEEFFEPEPEDMVLATDDVEEPEPEPELDLQNVTVEDTDIPDMDLSSPIEEDEEEDLFDEEDEEEEDAGWSVGRGRKKVKPTRQVKQPPKRPTKREPRRGY